MTTSHRQRAIALRLTVAFAVLALAVLTFAVWRLHSAIEHLAQHQERMP